MILPFQLPPPEGYVSSPKWDGKNFIYDEVCSPVLEYSENFEGWSDDLTALHEEVTGNSHPIDRASREDAIKQVDRLAPHAQSIIMEIGCSSGFLIRDLVASFPDALILGADVVKEPLYRLAETTPGIPLLRFDLLQCPVPDESVDILIMLNVLEHIENDVRALEAAFNMLKPGGSLIIEVPAGPCLYDSYDAELCHFRRYSASDLLKKLRGAGFTVDRKSHLGFIIFPAFATVKLFNKLNLLSKKQSVVRGQAKKTSDSRWLRIAMRMEARWFSGVALPFGIRVLAVAGKD
jgi:SAM-dependent methyltransferase